MITMSMTKLSIYMWHQPESIGLAMDIHRWVSVAELIEKISKVGRYRITESILAEIVRTDNKGRFRYSEDGMKIKVWQGHSISWVEPELTCGEPPEYLYHGTTANAYRKILESVCISKMVVMLSICRQSEKRHCSLQREGQSIYDSRNGHSQHTGIYFTDVSL